MVSKNEVDIGMKNYQMIKPVCVFIDAYQAYTHNKNVYSTYAVVYSTIFMFLVGFPRYSMDTAKTPSIINIT